MKLLFFSFFSDRMTEGGPRFMYPILLMLLICVALIIMAFVKGDSNGKLIKLTKSISLFALIWGFVGQMMALIDIFDSIQSTGESINQQILAAGIKVGLLAPLFGLIAFLIARLGIIGLILKEK